MGVTQQRERDSVQNSGLLHVTLRKTLQGSVRVRPNGPLGSPPELSPESPCPDPCLRAPDSSDPEESIPDVGFGFLSGGTGSNNSLAA